MKCFQCHKYIDDYEPYEVTIPDGDIFHLECLKIYEKEKQLFYDDVINDDWKFYDWIGISLIDKI